MSSVFYSSLPSAVNNCQLNEERQVKKYDVSSSLYKYNLLSELPQFTPSPRNIRAGIAIHFWVTDYQEELLICSGDCRNLPN